MAMKSESDRRMGRINHRWNTSMTKVCKVLALLGVSRVPAGSCRGSRENVPGGDAT